MSWVLALANGWLPGEEMRRARDRVCGGVGGGREGDDANLDFTVDERQESGLAAWTRPPIASNE